MPSESRFLKSVTYINFYGKLVSLKIHKLRPLYDQTLKKFKQKKEGSKI